MAARRKRQKEDKRQLYVIHVGRKEAIVGFRYPGLKTEEGKGENVPLDGEVRVASHLFAVLGVRSSMQYKWDTKASADHVASAIKGAKVVPL